MAGYIIHLAVGEEFIRNFPDKITNYEDFIEGIIYPDSVIDKSLTHYGTKSSKVNLKSFFNQRDITDDFNKGYFLHLVTDYLFYNKFLEVFSKRIYNDYDILNRDLEEEFQVKIPDKIRNKVFYKQGNTHILELNGVIKFIKETANHDLTHIKDSVLKGDKNWLQIRPLRNEELDKEIYL